MDIERYKSIAFEKRTHCLICENLMGSPVITLPDFPMTEVYTREPVGEKAGFLDQAFHLCAKCGHGQLVNVIDLQLQYGSTLSYYFRTSESATGSESADFFIKYVNSHIGKRHVGTIVELGCNDMYILRSLRYNADKLVGIDPILKGREKEFSEGNITAIGDFFENVDLDKEPDVVLCKDTLEHVRNPKLFMKKVIDKANDETLLFFQFPVLETLMDACRFDHIFHQHLNYFSLKSIVYMLNELGCELLDYTINNNHWGAILIAFKKSKKGSCYDRGVREITINEVLRRYAVFENNMKVTSERLAILQDETIYGYGAALMLPVLSYHLKNDLSCLKYVIDDDKRKEQIYYINLPVSIRTREKISDISNSIVLVTAIASTNNVRWILDKLFDIRPKQILLPLNTI